MPIKDPDRAAANNRKRQQAFKDREKLKKLSGGEPAAQGPTLSLVTDPPKGRKKAPLTMQQWAREKCELGQELVDLSKTALKEAKSNKSHQVAPRDAVVMLRYGIDLINANLPILQPAEGPVRGNVEQENAEWLRNPEYRKHMTEALKLKQALQSGQTG